MWNKPLVAGLVVFVLVMLVGLCASQNNSDEMREEENKATLLRFYDEILGQGKTEVVNELFSDNYIQHNPNLPNGPEGLIGLVGRLKSLDPSPVITVKHIAADGDFVAAHWHSSMTPEDEYTGQAGFDLFRLDDGTIVEHWDVIQEVPPRTESGNSMFSDLYTYPDTEPSLTEEQEEANRQLVINAYDGLFNGRQMELLDQYWAGDAYIQHNPQVPSGTAGLKDNFDAIWPEGSMLKINRALADGDLVFVFSQSLPPGADPDNESTGSAVADLFRVADGKIVEHWDVIQPVPATTASGNSMFSDLYRGSDAQ